MISQPNRFPHALLVQNVLATLVFILLFSGHIFAWFLNNSPANEWLWLASVNVNRVASSATHALEAIPVNSVLLSLTMIVLAILVPFICHWRKSLLGTALCGHMALCACIVMFMSAVSSVNRLNTVADLSPLWKVSVLTSNTMPIIITAAAMLVLCGLNHVIYLRSIRFK